MICKGVTRSTGDFTVENTGELRPYDNIVMHCLEKNNSSVGGFVVSQVKFNYSEIESVTEGNCKQLSDFQCYIDKDIIPIYKPGSKKASLILVRDNG